MISSSENRDVQLATAESVSPQRRAATTVGVALLLMTIAAMYANFIVVDGMLVPGDSAATVSNILANEMQFRLGILGFLVIIILDVIVAWGLYVFFEPVERTLSLLAGWFRLVYTAVFAAAIFNLGNALRILTSAETLALETGQMQAQVMMTLNAFNDEWDFALALFGIHLIVVGYLVLKADFMPRILGVLVVICGAGYLFDAAAGLLFPDLGVTVSQVTFIGELLLGLWLLVKGVSDKQWAKLDFEPVR